MIIIERSSFQNHYNLVAKYLFRKISVLFEFACKVIQIGSRRVYEALNPGRTANCKI